MYSRLTFQFDIKRINTSSNRLNPEWLKECNRLELVEQLRDPIKQDKLIEEMKELVKKTYPNDIKNLDLTNDHIKKVLEWSIDRITNLNELVEADFSFLWIIPDKSESNLSKGKFELSIVLKIEIIEMIYLMTDTLEKLVKMLTDEDTFERQHVNTIIKEFSQRENLKFKDLMQSLRKILSGKDVSNFIHLITTSSKILIFQEGPGIGEMMEILGKQDTLKRMQKSRK